MKYKYYNPVDEKGGCVYRSISKALNKDYNKVKEDITIIENKYDCKNVQKIFEEYLFSNGFIYSDDDNNKNIFDTNYDGINIVYTCMDDWFHLVCIIDNVIYDKKSLDELKDLKITRVYKIDNK